MALVSPGTEITVIDQSQYLPAAPSSVPMILLATAQNKSNAAGTGVAAGTTAANANKLYQVTSQRDLVTLYGNPFFYKTTNGTPIQGYELNEYGLLAAYSVLGSTNLCYVLRADIDLASLVGRTGRPSGEPSDGTHWLNITNSTFGIFSFNATTGAFTNKVPFVFTDAADMDPIDGKPLDSYGNIGDYAVTFLPTYPVSSPVYVQADAAPDTYSTYWYKDSTNVWVPVGSGDWRIGLPFAQSVSNPTLTPANTLIINGITITVQAIPNNTMLDVVSDINNAGIPFITAEVVNNRIELYSEIEQEIVIGGTLAGTAFGILAQSYWAPAVVFGSNAQQPLWRSTDSEPHPTGSVWIKTNAANLGTSLVVSRYDAATATYTSLSCPMSTSDWAITDSLDSTGGAAIVPGSVYAQYSGPDGAAGYPILGSGASPLQFFYRPEAGSTVVVGTETAVAITTGSTLTVQISTPNSSTLSTGYTVVVGGGSNAADFVTAWQAASIPYTTAEVSYTGAIVLTHTEGGVIVINDSLTSNLTLIEAGFDIGVTPSVKYGPYKTITTTGVAATDGSGSNAVFTVEETGFEPSFTVTTAGTGYVVGDIITIGTYNAAVTTVDGGGGITEVQWSYGYATPEYTTQLSPWEVLSFIANDIAPTVYPVNGTNWYYSVVNQVDIMVNLGGSWVGYLNSGYASNGLASATVAPGSTDPRGPIVAAAAPETQSDGTALEYGDIWIDTSDLDNYPLINRWQLVDGLAQWVLLDNTDQTTENGVLFADARWADAGTVDPINDAIPTIVSLLSSDYLDLDAPDPALYPQGTLLFNTRRSGYNVKEFALNYFNAASFPDQSLPQETSTWVTVSGNMTNGAPYMGRKAQRAMVVKAMKASISTNTQIREDETFFNLIACPNYPELQPDMVVLNNDRNNTGYIIGDTPLRLAAEAQAITDWANNTAGATSTGEQGLVTRNTYMGIYYPSAITTDLTGSEVVVPASHMMLRTIIYNDTVAYPWFAPAGQRRGIVDNATNIGYIDSVTGEFVTTKNRVGLRDIEYSNFINPIAYFTNVGILNYGNKNSFDSQSSLDRTNVARLICYIRERLQAAVRPFIFEPNDTITRAEVAGVCSTLMNDILAKRGIYDYIVVCDQSNNTPARIDRNELWVDIAIEPTKAVEFIYIPIRILNTGEIAGLGQNG